MGSDSITDSRWQFHNVSIHAPTWGATQHCYHRRIIPQSFNPRSHMGSDCHNWCQVRCCRDVSIHAPTWGATGCCRHKVIDRRVSIHAPTWGATNLRSRADAPLSCFNPRSHMGSDIPRLVSGSRLMFQSTLPHGERHTLCDLSALQLSFNPRSHMGSDLPSYDLF